MRNLFMLDPDVVFLNHGSFGATPKAVFDAYQHWQREVERQPVLFFSKTYDQALRAAREALAAYVHGRADDLVFVHNATFGVNVVARSLALQAGDEILTTNHEYGACANAWEHACRRTGARYVRHALPLPGEAGYDAAGLVPGHLHCIHANQIARLNLFRLKSMSRFFRLLFARFSC